MSDSLTDLRLSLLGLNVGTVQNLTYSDSQEVTVLKTMRPQHVRVNLEAGTGAYVVAMILSPDHPVHGIVHFFVNAAASTNPAFRVYDGSTGGTVLFDFAGQASASTADLWFGCDGNTWFATAPNEVFTASGGGGGGGATVTLTSPLALWRFDDASGNFADASTNSNTLIETDPVTRTSGLIGLCASFAGGVEFLNSTDALGDIGGAFSISAWIRGTSSGIIASVGNYNDGVAESFRLIVIDGTATFQIRDNTGSGTDYNSTAPFPNDGEWHHVVGVFDGEFIQCIVDTDPGTPTACPTGSNFAAPVVVGNGLSNASLPCTGDIDLVILYAGALTTGQINTLYAAGAGFDPLA